MMSREDRVQKFIGIITDEPRIEGNKSVINFEKGKLNPGRLAPLSTEIIEDMGLALTRVQETQPNIFHNLTIRLYANTLNNPALLNALRLAIKDTGISGLDLTLCDIGDSLEAIEKLGEIIKSSPTISTLALFANNFNTPDKIQKLGQVLTAVLDKSKPFSLDLSSNLDPDLNNSEELMGKIGDEFQSINFSCLKLAYHRINSIGNMQALGRALTNSTDFELDLMANEIRDPIAVKELVNILKTKKVRYLNLNRNNFSDTNTIKALKGLKNVTTLELSDCQINTVDRILALKEVLSNSEISSLNLENNEINTPEKLDALADVLESSKVSSLYLGSNSILSLFRGNNILREGSVEAKAINSLKTLLQRSNISYLDITWDMFDRSGGLFSPEIVTTSTKQLEALGTVLKDSKVTSLSITLGALSTTEQINAFSKVLKVSKVTSLELQNIIKEDKLLQIKALGQALKGSNVTSLILTRNYITTPEQIKELSKALNGSNVTSLDISKNKLTPRKESIKELIKLVYLNKNITTILLNHNIPQKDLEIINLILQRNKSIQEAAAVVLTECKTTPAKQSNSILPEDITSTIASFLAPQDCINLSLVNKNSYKRCNQEQNDKNQEIHKLMQARGYQDLIPQESSKRKAEDSSDQEPEPEKKGKPESISSKTPIKRKAENDSSESKVEEPPLLRRSLRLKEKQITQQSSNRPR